MVNEGFPQSLPNVVDEGCPHIYVVVRLHHIYVIALQCTSVQLPRTPQPHECLLAVAAMKLIDRCLALFWLTSQLQVTGT